MNPPRSACALGAAVSLLGAGLIHLAAVPSHVGSPAAVASFTGMGMVQILLGASLLAPGAARVKRLAVIGLGGVAIAAWALSRTYGLPALSGHGAAESVGAADLSAIALQLLSILLLVLPARSPQTRPGPVASALMAVPLIAVSALASVSLLSVPPHAHAPQTGTPQPRAAYVDGATLIERSVAIPATTSGTTPDSTPPADAGHVDAPGSSAHSH